jgi:hypothetical protein
VPLPDSLGVPDGLGVTVTDGVPLVLADPEELRVMESDDVFDCDAVLLPDSLGVPDRLVVIVWDGELLELAVLDALGDTVELGLCVCDCEAVTLWDVLSD